MDNTTVLAYMNHEVRTRSPLRYLIAEIENLFTDAQFYITYINHLGGGTR